jgi:hypothetical protein
MRIVGDPVCIGWSGERRNTVRVRQENERPRQEKSMFVRPSVLVDEHKAIFMFIGLAT